MEVRDPTVDDFDQHSKLHHAASPILARFSDELVDTSFSLLLADKNAQIIDRRVSAYSTASSLERVKAVPGARYVEQVSGTNSLSTAFETRKPIAVSGAEHYLEALRVFTCYGAPVINPVTRVLEGVLDISGPKTHENDLLKPILMRAVGDIEQRLVLGSKRSEQILFAEFQARVSRTKNAVIAMSGDLVIDNALARELLSDSDRNRIVALALEHRQNSHERTLPFELASGLGTRLTLSAVRSAGCGVIATVEVTTAQPDRYAGRSVKHLEPIASPPPPAARTAPSSPQSAATVLITGEPGTGKTTRALALAATLSGSHGHGVGADVAESEIRVLDCAGVSIGDGTELERQLHAAHELHQCVVIDNIHLLTSQAVQRIGAALKGHAGPVVFVGMPVQQQPEQQQALLSTIARREHLRPVRELGADFPPLLHSIVEMVSMENRGAAADAQVSHLRAVPRVVENLAQHSWPGNLNELIMVIRQAAAGRSSGDLVMSDLPDAYRNRPARYLTKLERAEHDAIVQAMNAAKGNKSAAAADLGIGRTTLYEKLRYYRIGG